MQEQAVASIPKGASAARPDVTVFWKPGCSSCLKVKEFVTELGIPFESVNIFEDERAMKEIMDHGLRGVPVVRKGESYVYAQSLDDVAGVLGVSRNHTRLTNEQLLERWEQILERTRAIAADFSDELHVRRVIPARERPIKDLCSQVFQICEGFMKQVDEGLVDIRQVSFAPRPDQIRNRDDLLKYADGILAEFHQWRQTRGAKAIPERLETYYGNQPSAEVLERGVWHSTQHARQLDIVAAGMGAELKIPQELYVGLPLPKRIWA
jgi:glutaredoxin